MLSASNDPEILNGEADETVPRAILVLGIGNLLLSDDGIGVHVVQRLEAAQQAGDLPANVLLRDGGTIGLTLLAEINPETAIIAIDAMELGGAPPGTVRCFTGADMDRQLVGNKKTAHEVALSDLIQAAQFSGCAPERRALVAVQPEITTLGLAPTPAVVAALDEAVARVREIIEEWQHD